MMRSNEALSKERVAARLEEVADLLEAQGANPFRVRAYRRAADTLRGLRPSLRRFLAQEGLEGLADLPGIGESLARSITELAYTGDLGLLSHGRGAGGAAGLLRTVPGLGPTLAGRIHERLGIESLAELELAAHDGRLERVPGMGAGRLRAVRECLAGRLGHRSRLATPAPRAHAQPPVSELLDVDREYREKVAAADLPRIAPRRFNSAGQRWLPVLHTRRGVRRYTALFSNTLRAHELDRTRDWVVIYRDDHHDRGQWTVVTERSGAMADERVVRGREEECERYRRAAGTRRDPGA
ncbi:MAG: helix-hairpin-helix domain-containing protein [Proteobacteria bacterium]|nr:helix-hairpin-helix domain-containing protein [Pseudomonadota bacterium]